MPDKKRRITRCLAAYGCLVAIGLAAIAQAATLGYGIYQGYVYRNWERPLGFIFEPLQQQHFLNLFWFWPITVAALIAAIALAASGDARLSCARSVGAAALFTLLLLVLVGAGRLSNFYWEPEVWRLLAVHLIYGSLLLYLGIHGYVQLKKTKTP